MGNKTGSGRPKYEDGQTVQKNIFSGVIIQLIFWAITLVVQRFRNISGNTPLPKAFIMAIVIILASSIYLEMMIFKQQEVDSTMAGISLVCILASNVILIYLYDSISEMFRERTQADVVIPENIAVDEDDMVVILGNILDNATEAAERLEENKYISIDLEYDKGSLMIHVENSYDSFVDLVNGKFVTRKEDTCLHGIGLQSVDAVVKKYDGLLEAEYDEERFAVDILLYI